MASGGKPVHVLPVLMEAERPARSTANPCVQVWPKYPCLVETDMDDVLKLGLPNRNHKTIESLAASFDLKQTSYSKPIYKVKFNRAQIVPKPNDVTDKEYLNAMMALCPGPSLTEYPHYFDHHDQNPNLRFHIHDSYFCNSESVCFSSTLR